MTPSALSEKTLVQTAQSAAKVPKKTLTALGRNPAALKKVLLSHVVAGSVPSSKVVKLRSAKTVEGARVKIRVRDAVSREAEAELHVTGLAPTGSEAFYELWLLDPDGKMVALGSFRVGADGHATIRVPLPVDPTSYRFFDISRQPATGDPAHSGDSVLRGPTRC